MNRELIEMYAAGAENPGFLPDHEGVGVCEEPECGDVLEFTFKTQREIITDIGYTITESACPPMKACAAVAAHLAKGKPVLAAYLITHREVAEKAGGLDKEQIHCAMMAELALKRSIINYSQRRKAC